MMKSPAGRYPFSRFMASPSRAKRSELEHDSLASTLPGSIGGEAVVANMDGPEPASISVNPSSLSLPKTRFVRIDGEVRQESDARQFLRTARSGVGRARPSQ